MRRVKKYKVEIILFSLGIILTFVAREHAIETRLAMGLNPSWGGEFAIIPIIVLLYATLKADWSVY